MDKLDRGQVTSSAAEIYESFFIPAMFAQWTDRVADAAQIQPGQYVLDVACGTGILARTVIDRVGTSGSVVGLDVNPGMLSVAKQMNAAIEWREGRAEDLPFDTEVFDAVVSQFGLMFFEERQTAINEMVRVLRPGGHLAVAVWDSLDNTPGYAAMVNLLSDLFGEKAANGLRAPYVLGDVQALLSLLENPYIENVTLKTHPGTARFGSIEKWVYTDIKGWVLSDEINEDQFTRLLQKAASELGRFVTEEGSVQFATPAHIVSTRKK